MSFQSQYHLHYPIIFRLETLGNRCAGETGNGKGKAQLLKVHSFSQIEIWRTPRGKAVESVV